MAKQMGVSPSDKQNMACSKLILPRKVSYNFIPKNIIMALMGTLLYNVKKKIKIQTLTRIYN